MKKVRSLTILRHVPLKAFELLETEERTVTRTAALTVNLAPAGGFVVWLERQ